MESFGPWGKGKKVKTLGEIFYTRNINMRIDSKTGAISAPSLVKGTPGVIREVTTFEILVEFVVNPREPSYWIWIANPVVSNTLELA